MRADDRGHALASQPARIFGRSLSTRNDTRMRLSRAARRGRKGPKMKSGTDAKLKFKKLQLRLGLELWQARGLLDTLWAFVRHNCPRGDIGRFTNEEIAIGIDWSAKHPDDLVLPLVAERWIDDDRECRLIIHDWPEHCEHDVHNQLARATDTFADGTIPKLTRLAREEREQIIKAYEVKYGREALESGVIKRAFRNASKRSANAPALPYPTKPLPSPTLPSPTVTPNGEGGGCELSADEFVSAWNATSGVHACRTFGAKRIALLRTRLKDPGWADSLREALKKFPLRCFANQPNGWKPDIEWILGPDAVTKVLEGKYDWEKQSDGKQQRTLGPGVNFTPGAASDDPL